jgi:hypothetical protein
VQTHVDADTWRLAPITGGTGNINHPWIATAPGCPDSRHPTRWCHCKVHPTKVAAEQYVTEQETQA